MKNKNKKLLIAAGMIITVLILMIIDGIMTYREKHPPVSYPQADAIISEFSSSNGLRLKDYPEELRALLEKNPETKDFVLNYPLKKDFRQSLTEEELGEITEIPYFLQWDGRWGYCDYAGSIMGIAGCGPVCLSMVSIYLTKDITFDPLYIAEFAAREGYATRNNGTKWLLMSEGAEKLGLKSEELPLDKNVMINALTSGKPIICIMGAGDFTSTGHYIVLTDYTEDGFSVLDPNSEVKSGQKWTYERIKSQIRNIWAFSSDTPVS